MESRNRLTCFVLAMASVLLVSAVATAQTAPSQASRTSQANDGRIPWKYYPTDRAVGDGGAAPKRDLTGTWAGPSSGAANPKGKPEDKPSFTPLGQKMFSETKPLGKYSPAGTNDPHVRYCDPFGFPQNMLDEIRGITITSLPNRTFILIQYMDLWREIWTDGRTLPTTVGAPGKNALDAKYNGYSVGHWEDDYTFVVDTTGLDPDTWASKGGYPHSMNAHVQERYHRDSKNDMTLSITMDDPTLYTKPFFMGDEHFRWIPNQMLDDFTCIPSQVQQYLQNMGDPAGSDPSAAGQPRALTQ